MNTDSQGYTSLYASPFIDPCFSVFFRGFLILCLSVALRPSAATSAATLRRLTDREQRIDWPLRRPGNPAQNHRLNLWIREVGIRMPLHPDKRPEALAKSDRALVRPDLWNDFTDVVASAVAFWHRPRPQHVQSFRRHRGLRDQKERLIRDLEV